ncbi:glycerophosphodiester phosphodiesterase family protein [Altererythrobacter sp.]|nr:glycerophosphodiester phosphodiesterase family protein [Altererythrobacter sp.]
MTGRAAPDWLTRWEYAHRGLHGNGVPENSLEAARLAIEAGMGVECDIQRSADNLPMVFHDWELDRLTGLAGVFGGFTDNDLRAYRLTGNDENLFGLGDLLKCVDGEVPLLIEIKSKRGYDVTPSCSAVAAVLRDYRGDHAVMSFDPRVARWFRRNSPETCCGLVMREDEHGQTQKNWQRRFAYWVAKPDFLAYHVAALPSSWVNGLRANGVPVLTWTVKSPELRQIGMANADALVSEGAGLA